MKSADQILKGKGYDNLECQEIISEGPESLDMKTREHFGLEDQALHLWESYYPGDADEGILADVATRMGYDDVDELMEAMDSHLKNLVNELPDK